MNFEALRASTLPDLLVERARTRPGRVAFRSKELGIWRETAWRELAERVAALALGFLRELRASQIVLEFANRGMEDLRLWKEFPTDKELGAGVIDVKAFKAESAVEVAERIHAVLKHVAPEKLWLNPDCGFWETPRWVVKQKLAAVVGGGRIVRTELGG